MGILCIQHLNDDERAIEYFEQALELDPNCLPAADHVCALYRKRDRWQDALVIYERFYQSLDALPHELALGLLTHMGEACGHLGKPDKAMEIFAQARKKAKDDPYLTISLAKSALTVDNASEALKSFSEFIDKFGEQASAEDRIEALIGKATSMKMLGGKDTEAIQVIRQAITLDPENINGLRIQADLFMSINAWRDAVATKRKLVDLIEDNDERITILKDMGQIESEQLKDLNSAVRTLNQAHELDTENRDVLGFLMKVHSASGNWSQVIEVVLKIADLIDDKAQLAKYLLTVGKIYRRELKQSEEALTYLDMALDEDATLLSAFDTIVQVHTDSQN